MSSLTKDQKQQLGILLAAGHKRFGKVKSRKPYREDDTGTGSAELLFETHPLLAQIPPGADSDLTANVVDNVNSKDEALEERSGELSAELRKNPVLAAALANKKGYVAPPPTPSPLQH